MGRITLLLLTAGAASAAITNVTVDVSATQARLHYTAPNTSGCTNEVSESNTYSPLVHDVDPTLFAGSTADNRSESLSDGRERVFIIGKRRAEQATSGRWYSRALQSDTTHYYRITCGSDTATGTFTTATIAMGNTYQEPLPPNPSVASLPYSFSGHYAWPEFINWSTTDPDARLEKVIDPRTGMALQRLTMPQDSGHYDDHTFVSASGTGWSSGDLLVDDTASSTYSASGRDWIVVGDSAYTYGDAKLESLAFSVKGWCSVGACATEDKKIEVCLSVNHGVSCWPSNSNVHEIALGTSALPSTYVSFGDGDLSMYPWTPAGMAPLVSAEVTKRSGTVNVDGSGNVTWAGDGQMFYPGWTGGKITIGSSVCTINSVAHPQLLTVTPASCSPSLTVPATAANYVADNFAVMIRKKTTSTDQINLQFVKYTLSVSAQMQWPNGGATMIFNPTLQTNSVTGHTGYHIVVGNTPAAYFIDSTNGRANYLGILNTNSHGNPDGWGNVSDGCHNNSITLSGASPNEVYYCTNLDENGKEIILKCTVTTTSEVGDWNRTCVNLTPGSTGKDILSLIAAFDATFDKVLFNSVGITAMQNGQLMLSNFRGFQDTLAWTAAFDPTKVDTAAGCVGGGNPGCVIAAHPSWVTAPCRWCTLHNATFAGQSNVALESGKYLGSAIGDPGGGEFISTVTSSMTNTASIAAGSSGCPSDAPHGCDLVTVDGEPCNHTPANALAGHPAEPLNCPKNGSWTWLQDTAVGDVLRTLHGPDLERMKIVSKASSTSWLLERGIGNLGIVTPSVPIDLIPECMARTDGFTTGVITWPWAWDFEHDPHGLNSGGTGITVTYQYDHQVAAPGKIVGGAFFADPNIQGGYAMLDAASGYGDPNKYQSLSPTFAGAIGLTQFNEIAQEHPSRSQYSAADQSWFLDARPLSGPGPSVNGIATLVSGQLYKYTSTTSDGDNLADVGGSSTDNGGNTINVDTHAVINRKLQPTMPHCGTQPLVDVSSAATGDVIADTSADAGHYCIARKANECRTGSSQGDIYMNCQFVGTRRAYQQSIGCNNVYPEQGLANDLCIGNTGAYLDGIVQIGTPSAPATFDSHGALGRTLTYALQRNRLYNPNEDIRTTPDGAWLVFEGLIFGAEYQILMGKMPSFTNAAEDQDRSAFLPVKIALAPPSGLGIDNAIIQFGYAENGDPASFYCTSRRESCIANAATVQTIPFQFPSDGSGGTAATVSGLSCASSCTIAIPAIPQRVVYYQIQYRNSSNVVVAQAGLQAVMAQ